MSQVIALPTKSAPKSQRTATKSRRAVRAMRRQALAAAGIGLVAATLTGLSLSHLAHGIALVTAAPDWQAWSMAVGIDLGFVGLELSQLTIGEKLRKAVACYTRPAIAGTLIGSAALNAFAFATGASGPLMQAAAAVLGLAIPGLIYALTRIGAAIYIDTHARS